MSSAPAHALQPRQKPSPSKTSSSQPLLEEILNLLSNVMFPVVVFLLWAVATTIGTIVDQNQPEQHYYDFYPMPIANAIVRLHLTNVFHSVPYISLVVLLLLSMSVCTFRRVIPKRFPKDRAVPIRNFGLHATMNARAQQQARTMPLRHTCVPKASRSAAKSSTARTGCSVTSRNGRVTGCWSRTWVSRLSPSAFFSAGCAGFSGQIVIFKGETVAVAPPQTCTSRSTISSQPLYRCKRRLDRRIRRRSSNQT